MVRAQRLARRLAQRPASRLTGRGGGGGGGGAPTITEQPQSLEVYEGQDALFSLTSTSADSYQWQTSPDESAWTNVGTDQNSYTFTNTVRSVSNGLYVRCLVTNSNGTTTSSVVQLSVWNPLALSSALGVWLDPTFGLFTERTGSVATTPTSADGAVGTWRARNGSINGIASADGNRPTYRATGLNGGPGVQFDGTDDTLNFNTPLASITRDKPFVYVFASVAPTSEAVDGMLLYFSTATLSSSRISVRANGGGTAGTLRLQTRRLDGDASVNTDAATAFTDAEPFVLGAELLYSTGVSYIRKDGERIATASTSGTTGNTGNANSTSVSLGSYQNGVSAFYDGLLGHLIVATPASAYTAEDMQKIEGYINYKGAFFLTLISQPPSQVFVTAGNTATLTSEYSPTSATSQWQELVQVEE